MSLEDDIRTTLLDDRRALPAWPDPAERVQTGMRLRSRRRRLAIATAGLVALAIAVPVTLAHANRGPAPTSAATVPWGGDVLVSAQLGMPAGPVPPPYAACRPADLHPQAVAEPRAAVGGLSVVVAAVKNISAAPCRMEGSPALYWNAAGIWRKLAPSEVPLSADPSVAAMGSVSYTVVGTVIGPGEIALVRIERSLACPPAPGTPGGFPQTYIELALGVGAGRLPIPGASLTGICPGVAVSHWFTPRGGYDQGLDGLSARLVRAGPARAGHSLDFVVTLVNPDRQPVVLPSPTYYATLVGPLQVVYQLRPAPAAIPAGGAVTYEMRVDLPATLPLGSTELTWQLGTIDTDVGASMPIDVTA